MERNLFRYFELVWNWNWDCHFRSHGHRCVSWYITWYNHITENTNKVIKRGSFGLIWLSSCWTEPTLGLQDPDWTKVSMTTPPYTVAPRDLQNQVKTLFSQCYGIELHIVGGRGGKGSHQVMFLKGVKKNSWFSIWLITFNPGAFNPPLLQAWSPRRITFCFIQQREQRQLSCCVCVRHNMMSAPCKKHNCEETCR